MPALSRSFVAVCVAVLAACLSAVLFARFGVSLVEALLIGTNLFIVALIVQEAAAVRRLMGTLWDRVEATRAAFGPIQDQINRLAQQMTSLSQPQPVKRDQSAEDVATLGAMVKDLADSISGIESRVAQQALALRQVPGAGRSQPEPPRPQPDYRPPVFEPPPEHRAPLPDYRQPYAPSLDPLDIYTAQPLAQHPAMASAPPPQAGRSPQFDSAVGEIVEAIGSDRVETYLQPIVSLPQRKVRSYEVFARLRLPDNTLLVSEEFIPTAESLGLAPVIDLRQFVRASQVVRRLSAKSKDIQVMVNVSPRSLTAAAFTSACIESARQSPGLATQVILELDQAAVRTLGQQEMAGLKSLAEAGYRFAMDQVADLRFDVATLYERGFRFVKIPALLLLDPVVQSSSEVHASDLGGLMRRQGIELIADFIDTEAMVRDLLDFDITLAQGHLFAAPRPVRSDVLTEEPPAPPAPPRPAPPKMTPPEPRRAAQQPAAPPAAASAQTASDTTGSSKAAWRTLARRVSRTET